MGVSFTAAGRARAAALLLYAVVLADLLLVVGSAAADAGSGQGPGLFGASAALTSAALASATVALAALACLLLSAGLAQGPQPAAVRTAIRERERRTAFLPQRDPDAAGRPRPRAPGRPHRTAA